MISTPSSAKAAPPPGSHAQSRGQNAVTLHDPSGTRIDIVAEDVGVCPGPGPTTTMRLRNADPDRSIRAVVQKSTNVGGTVTATEQTFTVAPMSATTLGCAAERSVPAAKPLTITEWKIISSRYQ